MPRGKKGRPPEEPPTTVKMTGPDGETIFEGTDAEFKAAANRARAVDGHRLNTINSNGDLPTSCEVAPAEVPIGEAIRQAVEQLGDIVIDADMAPQQLRELADVYEDVARAQAEFTRKSDAAKIAKKSLDSITNLLLEKVRAFTHQAPLPLFDANQAEVDRQAMVNAATQGAPA